MDVCYLWHNLRPRVSEGNLQESLLEFKAQYWDATSKDGYIVFAASFGTNNPRRESRGESYKIYGTVLGYKTPKTVGWYLRHRLGPTVSEGSLQKSIIEFVAPYLETKPKDVLMAFAALSETNLLRRES